jgi:hypothetical protein
MKLTSKTSRSPSARFLALLLILAFSNTMAGATITTGTSFLPYTVTDQEVAALLAHYNPDEKMEIKNIKIKFYDKNDELVYSAKVCQQALNCDERLNQLINQSDFITEVDDTRIYLLKQ